MKNITLIFLLVIGVKAVFKKKCNSNSYRVTLGDIESKTFVKDSIII